MSVSGAHQDGVAALDTFGVLIGCDIALPLPLADACRPDVLRCDMTNAVLYVGEAKAAESPGDAEAVGRIRHYLGWVAAHLDGDRRASVLALGVTSAEDVDEWCRAVARESFVMGLPVPVRRWVRLDEDLTLVIFEYAIRRYGRAARSKTWS